MDQPQRSTWPAHMHACACNANMISTLGLQLTLVRKRLQIPASWFTAQKPCDAAVMGPAVSNEDDNAYIQGGLPAVHNREFTCLSSLCTVCSACIYTDALQSPVIALCVRAGVRQRDVTSYPMVYRAVEADRSV